MLFTSKFFSELLFFPDMEFCETPHILCSGYQTDLHGVGEHSYPLEVGSDVDTETEGGASPDHALRMWMRGMKSEHSSCLSSRANSALSLTDTDHERKSDGENGNKEMHLMYWIEVVIYLKLSSSTSLLFSFCLFVCFLLFSSFFLGLFIIWKVKGFFGMCIVFIV